MSILCARPGQLLVQEYTEREISPVEAIGSQLDTIKHSVEVNIS